MPAAQASLRNRAASARRAPLAAVLPNDEIYERLLNAIVEHRLPPGTQLVEEKLAEVFKVSRTKIRQSLARLAHEMVVELQPNRGAFVAKPSIEFAREVFDARRLFEPALARRVALRHDAADVARLRRHVEAENAAHAAHDRRAVIRLSGEFHLLLAEMAGNSLIARHLREIESLTSLVIILYDGPNNPSCPSHEHADLVDAIERGDADAAGTLMTAHLEHVERSLNLDENLTGEIDFAQVFAP